MIRNLTHKDLGDIKDIFFNSFPQDEAGDVYRVISDIISDPVLPPPLCLGVEEAGRLVGAVAYSPVFFDDRRDISAYILSPLAVHRAHQKKGLATQLIKHANAALREQGIDVVLVYGDPAFYGKFGFDDKLAVDFKPPYPLQYPFGWQAIKLGEKDIGNTTLNFSCVNALSDASLW